MYGVKLYKMKMALNIPAVSISVVTESHNVDSHVSRMSQARSRDQVTPLQLHAVAPPLVTF